jgi:hypothetical protein
MAATLILVSDGDDEYYDARFDGIVFGLWSAPCRLRE